MSIIPEACFFTGHRVIDKTDAVLEKLTETITEKIEKGVSVFICGGALGFDTLAAQTVIELREKYPIKLCLYLPCRDQCNGWEFPDIVEYERIKSACDEVFYVTEDGKASAAVMKKRNKAMVEASDFGICYLKNAKSGTAQTVRMAEEKGIEVINLYENM